MGRGLRRMLGHLDRRAPFFVTLTKIKDLEPGLRAGLLLFWALSLGSAIQKYHSATQTTQSQHSAETSVG